MATNLTSKGQVTVPKKVRDYLGLKPGAPVTFERLDSGEIALRAAKSAKREDDNESCLDVFGQMLPPTANSMPATNSNSLQ